MRSIQANFDRDLPRFPTRPGGFTEADEVEPGLLHQFHAAVEPLPRHVFVIVKGALQHLRHLRRPVPRGRRHQEQQDRLSFHDPNCI